MGALEMDEVWVHVIVALAHGSLGHGCFGERDEVWVKLYGFPLDAPGQAGNDQVF